MDRIIEFRMEIDQEKNYRLTSFEPESGTGFIVDTGNMRQMNEDEFEKKVGMEVLSWIECWMDEEDAE